MRWPQNLLQMAPGAESTIFRDKLSRLCAHQPINDVNDEASKADKDLSELSS
jgi:hypothetical protein